MQNLKKEIEELRKEINNSNDIDHKEELYEEIDQLNDKIYSTTQDVLNAILPEAFAVVKETAKRFVQNTSIKVRASAVDREIAGKNPTSLLRVIMHFGQILGMLQANPSHGT